MDKFIFVKKILFEVTVETESSLYFEIWKVWKFTEQKKNPTNSDYSELSFSPSLLATCSY